MSPDELAKIAAPWIKVLGCLLARCNPRGGIALNELEAPRHKCPESPLAAYTPL